MAIAIAATMARRQPQASHNKPPNADPIVLRRAIDDLSLAHFRRCHGASIECIRKIPSAGMQPYADWIDGRQVREVSRPPADFLFKTDCRRDAERFRNDYEAEEGTAAVVVRCGSAFYVIPEKGC